MPDISEFSDEPGKVWKLTGPNSISSPGIDGPTYHHTPNSNDVRMPLDGARLTNIQPMGEEFYDKAETGPMFTAEAEGFDGVLHLFADEIHNLPPSLLADWDVLAAQAEKDHRAANERYYAAKEASEEAAFRQLIFTAMGAGVVKMRISPSDQGDWMTVDWAEDDKGEDMLDGPLDNELHDGTSDLPDTRNATWTRATGVTVEEDSRHDIHMASIDVMTAATALVNDMPQPERELNIGSIVYYLNKEHGVPAFLEDTGGGVLAIYAGQPFDKDEHGDQRFPALAGPGHHSRTSDRPVFTFDELYLGQDDEGETDPLTIHTLVEDERDVAVLIAAQANLRRGFVLTEASASTHLYSARTRNTN